MKFSGSVVLVALAGLAGIACGADPTTFEDNEHGRCHYEAPFAQWQDEFGVAIDAEDYEYRLGAFADADDLIRAKNAAQSTFTLAHNKFSHLTWEEFRDMYGIGIPLLTKPAQPIINAAGPITEGAELSLTSRRMQQVQTEVDWRAKGAVTPVKDQGACGSCWSFSTTGAMEGAYFLKTGELVSFSEQMLVDCDNYDEGCGGGLMDYSFHWIQQNGGICREEDYPYDAVGGVCHESDCVAVPGTGLDTWVDVPSTEADLMAAVEMQPISVAIEADEITFQFYSGGVLTDVCGTNLDHGVLLVGYGTDAESGVDYWTIKNSWGPAWGDNGFIRIERGAPQEGGECGILMQASYPVLESSS